MARQALKDFARFTLSLALVCAIGLPVLELMLRVFTSQPFSVGYLVTHPTRHFELARNFTGRTYDASFKTNSLGMRDDERPVAVGPRAYRIVVLGDSISFGQGVEQDQIYPKVLERKLNAIGSKQIQVFNLSVPGYNHVTEWELLRERLADFKPDLVLFQFTLQDDTVATELPGSTGGINQIAAVRAVKDELRNLYSYTVVASRLAKLRQKTHAHAAGLASKKTRVEQVAELYSESYAGWRDTRKAFAEISAFSQQSNVPVVFAIFSDAEKISPDRAKDEWTPLTEKLETTLHASGLRYTLSVSELFRPFSGKERELRVRADDYHLSARAHEVVATGLVEYLQTNKLVPTGNLHAER